MESKKAFLNGILKFSRTLLQCMCPRRDRGREAEQRGLAAEGPFLVGAAGPGQDGFFGCPKVGVAFLSAPIALGTSLLLGTCSIPEPALPPSFNSCEKETAHRQVLMMTANIMTHIIQSAPLQV